jgi:serine/threonine protein kinase
MTKHTAPALKTGVIVAGYRIEAVLGAGGMGRVYLAHDTRTRQAVAIKLVDPQRQRPRDLVREARLAASLDHPSICAIHGVDYLGEVPLLVMAHIKGLPLSRVIRGRRSVSMTTALDFARQIASAVQHAHERGVIHGDLKSSNIMIGPNGHVTILDFGLAVRADACTSGDDADSTRLSPSSGAAGTVPYMAPEIIRGQPPSVRSDIWALGVLIFEMVVGRRPFAGHTPYEIASNILVNHRTRMESLVQGPVREVIDRCLAVDPADRYQSARELSATLRLLRNRRKSAQSTGRSGPESGGSENDPQVAV